MSSLPPAISRRATLTATGLSLLLCSLTFLAIGPAHSDAPGVVRYVLTELPGLGGHSNVNSVWTDPVSGDTYAVGSTKEALGYDQATLWHNQERILLGTLGRDSAATALRMENGEPVVVGFSSAMIKNRLWQRAFQWQDGTMSALPDQGRFWCRALDVNSEGTVIGESQPEIGLYRATLWNGDEFSEVEPEANDASTAAAIDGSAVVGFRKYNYKGPRVAALWQGGVRTDLGTLGGSESWAYDVALVGGSPRVVGEATLPFTTVTHAYVWQDGTMADLGTLGGSTSSATSINRQGQIVGSSWTVNHVPHATIWKANTAVDLNDLVLNGADVELYGAAAIDANGVIAATGRRTGDLTGRAYLLRPVLLTNEPPVLGTVAPSAGKQGETLNVVLSGTGLIAATTVDFGPGISVNHVSAGPAPVTAVQTPTTLTVNISIAGDAPLGSRSIRVTNPDQQWDVAEGVFTVLQGPPALSYFGFIGLTTLTGGDKLRGGVVLSLPAPSPKGAKITFTSSNRKLKAPKSVTVHAGALTLPKPFAYQTKQVKETTTYTLTATYGGVSRSVTLTLLPKKPKRG